MPSPTFSLALAGVLLLTSTMGHGASEDAAPARVNDERAVRSSTPPVDFVRDIAPILAARCIGCHGPEKERSGYRLDVRAIALAGGELSAPNIVPGDAAGSALIRYISGADPEIEMPPRGEPVSAQEVALIRQWIDEGANWPEHASAQVEDRRDWWSLKPIVRPTIEGAHETAAHETAAHETAAHETAARA
ncbi:MAG: c-type cytochrome domain-containing protein, partial [bacterium]